MSRPVVESTLFRARRRLGEEYDELVSGRRCEQVRAVVDRESGRSVRSLGIRERRRVAKHLAHCQPCRRYARLAGIDDSAFEQPGIASKVAGLLPFPFLRWRGAEHDSEVAAASAPHSAGLMRSADLVSRFADPAAPALGVGRAAAAAAALVIAGAGGGIVVSSGGFGPAKHPAKSAKPAAAKGPASSAARAVTTASSAANAAVRTGPAGGAAARALRGAGASTTTSAGGGSTAGPAGATGRRGTGQSGSAGGGPSGGGTPSPSASQATANGGSSGSAGGLGPVVTGVKHVGVPPVVVPKIPKLPALPSTSSLPVPKLPPVGLPTVPSLPSVGSATGVIPNLPDVGKLIHD
jgi:hypothetical protein